MARRSTPKPHGPLYSPSELRGPLPFPSEPHGPLFTSPKLPDPLPSPPKPRGPLSIYLLQNLVDLYLSTCFRTLWFSLFTSEPRGPPILWLPRPGLNPSTCLPLQPHFRLLLQSVTPASIPVFFQLSWAAIVSLGRCGPMAWSQSSPSPHAGPVTRGSCFPVPSWVEFAPILLAQSMATAI